MLSHRRPLALAALLAGSLLVSGCSSWWSEAAAPAEGPSASASPTEKSAGKKKRAKEAAAASAPTPATGATPAAPQGVASDKRRLVEVESIGGAISPKSVVASGTGVVFAQNMMYRHSVTAYDSDGKLLKTIDDSVRLADFGVKGHPGTSRGAPVEMAFSPDGRYGYVSNYSMYGSGFGPEGSDTCTPSSASAAGVSASYLYRVDVQTLEIDEVIKVGMVPKYVAVSPDGSRILVTNWCSYSMTVIDAESWKRVGTVSLGAYPRGIVVSPDSSTAYVAVMGSSNVSVVDLGSNRVTTSIAVGSAPRHVVIDPEGRYLYATLNGANQVVKVDLRTGGVVRRVTTGSQPRSMAIAPDGRSLYVVNYSSDTVSKVRTRDMKVLQRIGTGVNPIGITYDPVSQNVWVAIYTGALVVLNDRA
jgi:YVTN family beta-propeller protein